MNMENKVSSYMGHFCPFGYRDIETAIVSGESAGKSIDEIAECVNDYSESTGTPIGECDPVYCLYDWLQQEARQEIEEQTGVDISNDKPYYGVNVSGNYMATSFDGKTEDKEATRKLIDTMTNRSEVVSWYYNQLS
jgi:hypothetical protein